MTATYFNNQYGQSKIDEIKTYIQNNQVKIIHAFAQIPSVMPCISIRLVSSQEREDEQQFSNFLPEEEEAITPTIIVDPVTPLSYNTASGKLQLHAATDISLVCPGMNYIDASDVAFSIGSGNSNVSGNKYINIGSGQTPDISSAGRIESSVNKKYIDRRMIRLREVIEIGCHAKDDLHLAKFLYYIILYGIKSRQETLIQRGIHLDSNAGSAFDKQQDWEGEHIYSRILEIHCLTEFDWDQAEVNLLDCFELEVKVPAPNPDSTVAIKVNTSN